MKVYPLLSAARATVQLLRHPATSEAVFPW